MSAKQGPRRAGMRPQRAASAADNAVGALRRKERRRQT
jgi:hypothetical protein